MSHSLPSRREHTLHVISRPTTRAFAAASSKPTYGHTPMLSERTAAAHRPEAQGSSLYPNEVAADFAFIPFGGGMRKCVGDQFALLEATVGLAMLLRCGAAVQW